ncbi:VWA domain-containing protein [Nocardioides carbamazepini]|uniref:VWA domain-containing protein n=1 Tax=Nocardioides carbamazepini TaxID=2854259 RepID=UPI00214A1802|nr:VWA domain-containing protein [Nocardioides carbamazepini]MCR1785897.1 VWA domain-containing protein [Nocardioides carbamazepini]
MGVIQWWVGGAIVAAAAVAGLVSWRLARPRRTGGAAVLASSLDRVRALPAFRALARQEWRRRLLETACLVLALAGAALMAARLVGVSDDAEEMRTREVVLCLDVSGSMRELDADVIDTYLELAGRLREERIGFVVFDANAVTVFPLTTDREYVIEQLNAARKAVADKGTTALPGVTAYQVGSSLIGDGLATCVRHFDRPDALRSRTIVLATDNELAGDAVYTLPQAARLAEESGVMVFGIMPERAEPELVDELRAAVAPTSGEVLSIEPGERTNVARISSAIKAQQKTAVLASAQDRSFDLVTPGAVLFLLGLAGSLVARGRRP